MTLAAGRRPPLPCRAVPALVATLCPAPQRDAGHPHGALPRPEAGPLLQQWTPRRVLVFRALNLGDMLCAVPALRALRRALPTAHITLLGLPWAADFAHRFADLLDGHLSFPGYPALPERETDVAAWPRFLAAVQAQAFDLVVQMHGNGHHTNAMLALLGARVHTGFCDAADRSPWCLPWPTSGPEPLRLLALARHLGAPADDGALAFPLQAADAQAWAAYPEVRRAMAGPYLCLHPGGRAAEKRWPVAHFAAVADRLHEATGLPVVLTGGAEEATLTAAVRRAMRHPAVDAAAPVPVGGLAALIAGSELLVSNDTGASHLAAALRVPSVVIFRCTDLARWAPLNRALHRVVWDPAGDRVADVLAAAMDLLQQG